MGGGPEKEFLLSVSHEPEATTITNRIRQKFPYIEVVHYQLEKKQASDIKGEYMYAEWKPVPKDLFQKATILVTLSSLPPKAEDAPNLKFVHLLSAGVDHIVNNPVFKDTDIAFTTSSGIHGVPISEWVLMTTLVAAKNYNTMHDLAKEHKWDADASNMIKTSDFLGKTVGIAGYGSIGRQVARIFTALGARVHAFTATPRSTPSERADDGYILPGTGDPDGALPEAWYSGKTKADLHTFLGSGLDVLVISLPLTPATKGLFRREEFEVLKKGNEEKEGGKGVGCFLVNVSRGTILDQAALVDSLNADTLSGAALDVTDPEPLPSDNPLWSAKNVVITPHISGLGREYMQRAFGVLMANLERQAQGKQLFNLVKRNRGY